MIVGTLRQIAAFFKRDFINAISYKTNFFFSFVIMFTSALTFGVLGKITEPAMASMLEEYGGVSFSTFMLVGMMFNNFLQGSIEGPRGIVSPGNIERVLMSPVSIPTFTLGTMSYGYFWRAMNLLIYTFVGIYFFDMSLIGVNWVTLSIILCLGIISMWGLGVISAGFQLVTKRWDPISWFLNIFSGLISGVWYDPKILFLIDSTGLLYKMAWCLPQTYVLYMERQAFIGKSFLELFYPYGLSLCLITVIVFPIGIGIFLFCLKRCKNEGSLGWI